MWKKTENSDSTKPLEVDEASSRKYVYIRRNFELVETQGQEAESAGEDAETAYHWRYEEKKIPKADWLTYRAILDNEKETEQVKADLLYISMMTGVEL